MLGKHLQTRFEQVLVSVIVQAASLVCEDSCSKQWEEDRALAGCGEAFCYTQCLSLTEKPGTALHTCNPVLWEVESGGLKNTAQTR